MYKIYVFNKFYWNFSFFLLSSLALPLCTCIILQKKFRRGGAQAPKSKYTGYATGSGFPTASYAFKTNFGFNDKNEIHLSNNTLLAMNYKISHVENTQESFN